MLSYLMKSDGFNGYNDDIIDAIQKKEELNRQLKEKQDKFELEKKQYTLVDAFKDSFLDINLPYNQFEYIDSKYSGKYSKDRKNIFSKEMVDIGKEFNLYNKDTWRKEFGSAGSPRELVALLENRKRSDEARYRVENYADGVLEHTAAFVGSAAGIILDPTILLPTGAITTSAKTVALLPKYYKTTQAVSMGAMTGVSAGISEQLLQKAQGRSDTDRLIETIGVSSIFGGALGAYLGHRVAKQINEADNAKVINSIEDETIREEVRAAAIQNLKDTGDLYKDVDGNVLNILLPDGTTVKPKKSKDVLSSFEESTFEQLDKWKGWFSVAPRTIAARSQSQTVQNIGNKLFPNTFIRKGKVNLSYYNKFTNAEIDKYSNAIKDLSKQEKQLVKEMEGNPEINHTEQLSTIKTLKQEYTTNINSIRANELDKATRTSGEYLIQGETAAETKAKIIAQHTDTTIRQLRKGYAEHIKAEGDNALSVKDWREKVNNDYNLILNKAKYESYKLYKKTDAEELARLYKEETGLTIVGGKLPKDFKSTVTDRLAKDILDNSNLSAHITPEMKAVREYYAGTGSRATKAGVKGMQGIKPHLYNIIMYRTNIIRDTPMQQFIAEFTPAIMASAEFKIMREELIEEAMEKGTKTLAEVSQAVDRKLTKQATTIAEQLKIKIERAESYKDLEDQSRYVLGKIKHRTVPLDETLIQKYLVTDINDKINYHTYKYSGKIALAEKLGITSVEDYSKLLRESGATSKEINAIEAMVEDILGVRGLNIYHSKGMTQFYNELKKFNFASMMEDAWWNASVLEAPNALRVIGKEFFNTDSLKFATKAVIEAYHEMFPNHIKGVFTPEEKKFVETFQLMGEFMSMDLKAFNHYMENAVQNGDSSFAHTTSTITEMLSHAYGMKPTTYAMQMHTRAAFLVDLLNKGKTTLSKSDVKKYARYGLTEADILKFNKVMEVDDFKGVIENFNFDKFKDNMTLLDRVLDATRRAGEDMVIHYDASVLPSWVTKHEGGLAGLALQFLKFPIAANEQLMLVAADNLDARAVSAIIASLSIGYMNTVVLSDLKQEIGLKESNFYRDKETGELDVDRAVTGTLGYTGFAGVAPTIGEKMWHAIEDVAKGKPDDAFASLTLGISASTADHATKVLTNGYRMGTALINDEDVNDEDRERLMKNLKSLTPFYDHLLWETARVTAKHIDKDFLEGLEEEAFNERQAIKEE